MSLFGKILAFLNILGALGLFCLSAMDYGKRRAWAYSLFRHDLVLTGLPLDRDQGDRQGRPLAAQFSEEILDDLFGPGGPKVATQADEVRRVRAELEGQFASAAAPAQKVRVGASLLLPLARNEIEREGLLVCRKEFAADKSEAAFKARLLAAYLVALTPPPAKGKDADAGRDNWVKSLPAEFERRFRQALRDDAGGPADPFAGAVAALTLASPGFIDRPAAFADPKELAGRFDGFFAKAVADQADALRARFDEAFDEAAYGPRNLTGSPPTTLTEGRRVAVARLLFSLAPALAEPTPADASAGLTAAAQDAVLATDGYRKAFARLQVVCGLEATLAAITEQGQLLRQMSDDLNKQMTGERLDFVASHGVLLELVRDQAKRVAEGTALLTREEQNLADLKGVVERRKKDVTQYEEQLQTMRAATAADVERLRAMSQKLYDLRIVLRDTRVQNQKGEAQIRELENKVRELEGR